MWTAICHPLGKPECIPTPDDDLSTWCPDKGGRGRAKRDANAIIILIMWQLWKHRNSIIFDGATPSKLVILAVAREAVYGSKRDY